MARTSDQKLEVLSGVDLAKRERLHTAFALGIHREIECPALERRLDELFGFRFFNARGCRRFRSGRGEAGRFGVSRQCGHFQFRRNSTRDDFEQIGVAVGEFAFRFASQP